MTNNNVAILSIMSKFDEKSAKDAAKRAGKVYEDELQNLGDIKLDEKLSKNFNKAMDLLKGKFKKVNLSSYINKLLDSIFSNKDAKEKFADIDDFIKKINLLNKAASGQDMNAFNILSAKQIDALISRTEKLAQKQEEINEKTREYNREATKIAKPTRTVSTIDKKYGSQDYSKTLDSLKKSLGIEKEFTKEQEESVNNLAKMVYLYQTMEKAEPQKGTAEAIRYSKDLLVVTQKIKEEREKVDSFTNKGATRFIDGNELSSVNKVNDYTVNKSKEDFVKANLNTLKTQEAKIQSDLTTYIIDSVQRNLQKVTTEANSAVDKAEKRVEGLQNKIDTLKSSSKKNDDVQVIGNIVDETQLKSLEDIEDRLYEIYDKDSDGDATNKELKEFIQLYKQYEQLISKDDTVKFDPELKTEYEYILKSSDSLKKYSNQLDETIAKQKESSDINALNSDQNSTTTQFSKQKEEIKETIEAEQDLSNIQKSNSNIAISVDAKQALEDINAVKESLESIPNEKKISISVRNTDYSSVPLLSDEEGNVVTAFRGVTNAWSGLINQDGIGFFTDKLELAADYADSLAESGKVFQANLSFHNPLEIEGNGVKWNEIDFDGGKHTTDEIIQIAKDLGYDGVIFKNIRDGFSDTEEDISNVMVALNAAQIKNEQVVGAVKAGTGELTNVASNSNNISDNVTTSVVDSQNKIQNELQETQNQAEKTAQSISEIRSTPQELNAPSDSTLAIEQQNKLQSELKETQAQAEETAQTIKEVSSTPQESNISSGSNKDNLSDLQKQEKIYIRMANNSNLIGKTSSEIKQILKQEDINGDSVNKDLKDRVLLLEKGRVIEELSAENYKELYHTESLIGKSKQDVLFFLQKENAEIAEGNKLFRERMIYFKDGKVVQENIGDSFHVKDKYNRSNEADEFLHTHSEGKLNQLFSIEDMFSFMDEFSKGIKIFSVLSGNKLSKINLSGLNSSSYGDFVEQYINLFQSVASQFQSFSDKSSVPQDKYNTVVNNFQRIISQYITKTYNELEASVEYFKVDGSGDILPSMPLPLKNSLRDAILEVSKFLNSLMEKVNQGELSIEDAEKQLDEFTVKKFNKKSTTSTEPKKDAFLDTSTDTKPEIEGMEQVEKATEEAVQAKKDFATANEGVQSSIDGSENPLKLEAELMEQIAKSAREAADAKKEFVEANKQVKDSAEGSNSKNKQKDKYAKHSKISEDDFLNNSNKYFSIANEKLSNSGYTILGGTVNLDLIDGLVKVSAKIKDIEGNWKTFSARIDADGNMFSQRFRTITKGVNNLDNELANFGKDKIKIPETDEQIQKFKELNTAIDDYASVRKRIANGKAFNNDEENSQKLLKTINEIMGKADGSATILSSKQLSDAQDKLDEINKTISDIQQKNAQKTENNLLKIRNNATEKLSKYTNSSKYTPEFIERVNSKIGEIRQLNITKPEDIARLKAIDGEIKEISDASQDLTNKLIKQDSKISDIISQMKIFKSQNTNMSSSQKQALNQMITCAERLEKAGRTAGKEFDDLRASFSAVKADVAETGNTGKSFFNQIGNRLTDMNSKFIAQFFSWQDWIRYLRQAAQIVTQINTNITELAKVSEQTSKQIYADFDSYADIAKEIGGTISDTISATADWSRNGYAIPDAKKLAEVALLYKNVGDGIDINEANESLISTLRGFKLEADQAEHIVDVFNEVDLLASYYSNVMALCIHMHIDSNYIG